MEKDLKGRKRGREGERERGVGRTEEEEKSEGGREGGIPSSSSSSSL